MVQRGCIPSHLKTDDDVGDELVMSSEHSNEPIFCVSIHDVAVPSWDACQQLVRSIPQLADLPLTLLLVPDWHGHSEAKASQLRRFVDGVSALQAKGHELCLHGYTHLDSPRVSGNAGAGLLDWWQRRMMTRGEGEFAALDERSASERLHQGQAWLASHGWSTRGFVPPAWLINRTSLCAVREAGFDYLGLYRGWVRLSDEKKIPAPTITYSTRHSWGDALWRGLQDLIAAHQRHNPVLRLALHPADLQRPENLEHARRLIAHCVRLRKARTEHQAYLQSFIPRAACPMRKD